jgi:adenine specific DNA methylase Mod
MKKQNAKINIHREPRKRHTVKRQKPPQRRHVKNNQPSIRTILQEGKTMTEKNPEEKSKIGLMCKVLNHSNHQNNRLFIPKCVVEELWGENLIFRVF